MQKHFINMERKIERAINHGKIPRYYHNKEGVKMKTNPYALARSITGFHGSTHESKEHFNSKQKLILTGKPSYLHHMFLHLKKEHPSTRKRMFLSLKGGK